MFISVKISNTTHLFSPLAGLEHPDAHYIPALNALPVVCSKPALRTPNELYYYDIDTLYHLILNSSIFFQYLLLFWCVRCMMQ